MTVTYDLTTDVGKVRLIITDNILSDAHFTDEEITYFLTAEGCVNLAAAACLESWAAAYALNADNEHMGDYTYAQSITQKMLALAARLRTNVATTPASDIAEWDFAYEAETEG